jgi:hypothetical protein
MASEGPSMYRVTQMTYNGQTGNEILPVRDYRDGREDQYESFPGLVLFRLMVLLFSQEWEALIWYMVFGFSAVYCFRESIVSIFLGYNRRPVVPGYNIRPWHFIYNLSPDIAGYNRLYYVIFIHDISR